MGAEINALYDSLPATGGQIVVNESASFASPIHFGAGAKPVLLVGLPADIGTVIRRFAPVVLVFVAAQIYGIAQGSGPCPRFPAGSSITAPEDLFSRNGLLQVHLTYETALDTNGNTLFCFVNSDGAQSPTLHVHPGDRLLVTLTNNLPDVPGSSGTMGPCRK